jgi:opacity protein-like surface antigen
VLLSQGQTNAKVFYDPAKRFSLKIYGEYISSSELQNNINSTNPIEKDASVDLDGGFGYGFELTYDPRWGNSDITLYISTEYYKHKQNALFYRYFEDTTLYAVQFEEEFYFIPIEAGIKWDLPVSGENLKIYIGGGAGVYLGDRKRNIRGHFSTTNNVKWGYSLDVLSGVEYYIASNLSSVFEFKFREPYFEVESKFADGRNPYFGMPNPLTSRIVVNGTALSLGLKYNF